MDRTTIVKVDGEYIARFAGEVMFRGPKIAIMYTYHPDEDRYIRGCFHKYGNPEYVKLRADTLRAAYASAPALKGCEVHYVETDSIEPHHIERFLEYTGSMGTWHEAFILNDAKAQEEVAKWTR